MDELVRAQSADVAALRERLAALEEAHATLQAELAAFHADYMREVGTIAAELDAVRAKLLRRAAERARAAGDAGAGDRELAAADAEERARRTTAEARAVPEPGGPAPTRDLKALFREAAKRMHPDLARDDAGRAHAEAFMKRLTRAYREGDAATIGDLLRQWEASPHAAPDGPARTDALRAAVARAEERLASARAAPLARLMEQAMAAAARGEDLLATLRARALEELGEARERYASMSS